MNIFSTVFQFEDIYSIALNRNTGTNINMYSEAMRKGNFTKVKIGIRMCANRNRNRTRSTNINMYSKAMRRGPASKVKTVIQI